jgi:hypothetical protein
MEAAYEAGRTWALQPVSHPPAGWAQIVRGGIATWVRETHPPVVAPQPAQEAAQLTLSPLLTLVAAMIAEVCQ